MGQHLVEIVELFGPFPRALLDRADQDIVKELFYEEGMVKGMTLATRPDFNSETWFPRLSKKLRDESAGFLWYVMAVDPAERPTPENLLRHPWLDAL